MSAPRRPAQFDLFTGALEEPPASSRRRTQPVGPAAPSDSLRMLGEQLPRGVYLGTSSWTFPGWSGLVYDHEASTSQLAREGLGAYAHHPVLRTVGIDRTFYAPVPATTFAEYAQQVPERCWSLTEVMGFCLMTVNSTVSFFTSSFFFFAITAVAGTRSTKATRMIFFIKN